MVWHLAALPKVNETSYSGQDSYVSAPAAKVYENPWTKYFSSSENSSVQPVKQVNTYDAMAQLNALNEAEKAQKPETSSAQNSKETEKKEKAQKKLSKLSEALQNNKSFEMNQKHNDALNMIENNPDLASLAKPIKEKLASVFNQSAFLQSKVLLTQSQSDLTADKILGVVNEVKQMFAQLQKDWQKITSGLIKTGAYSEAMMKVDDDEKKDKYKAKAYEIVASMPDAFRNKQEAQEVEQELEDLDAAKDAQDMEDETISSLETAAIDFANPSEANPFAIASEKETSASAQNTDAGEKSAIEAENDTEEADEAEETDASAELPAAQEDEKDDELESLKKEVKDELKLQAEKKKNKNNNENNYYQDYLKAKVESLNSVLFAA